MLLFDLILIGMGVIFGLVWLFVVSNVVLKVGFLGVFFWIIGGVIILLIGFVYVEFGVVLFCIGGII